MVATRNLPGSKHVTVGVMMSLVCIAASVFLSPLPMIVVLPLPCFLPWSWKLYSEEDDLKMGSVFLKNIIKWDMIVVCNFCELDKVIWQNLLAN